jgi:hypothetical protein
MPTERVSEKPADTYGQTVPDYRDTDGLATIEKCARIDEITCAPGQRAAENDKVGNN